jgi:hypothetical protein
MLTPSFGNDSGLMSPFSLNITLSITANLLEYTLCGDR